MDMQPRKSRFHGQVTLTFRYFVTLTRSKKSTG